MLVHLTPFPFLQLKLLTANTLSMYQQPLRPQQNWSGPQFTQAPKPTAISTWATAPVITSVHPASAATADPALRQSFVLPAPPGVNPQQW
jgi:hypothetical protein